MSRSKPSKPHKGQVASRKEKRHDVNLAEHIDGLLNHDGTPVDECVVVVNSVTQQEKACGGAHTHVETAAPASEKARAAFVDDIDVLANAKMIEVLHLAFRIKDDDKYPLFLTPKWMRDGLTGIGVGILSNIYAECQKAEEPGAWPEIDRESIDQTLALCTQHFNDDIPELVLAQHEREWLTQWIVMASYFLQRERCEAAELVAGAIGHVEDEAWNMNAQAYLDELPDGVLKEPEPEPDDDADS